jgi:PadR family transcriptional regulator PadR
MFLLKAASLAPSHRYGILLRMQRISKDRLEIQHGSLYPALCHLEHQGWIGGQRGESENKRKAKYYRLTAACLAKRRCSEHGWSLAGSSKPKRNTGRRAA